MGDNLGAAGLDTLANFDHVFDGLAVSSPDLSRTTSWDLSPASSLLPLFPISDSPHSSKSTISSRALSKPSWQLDHLPSAPLLDFDSIVNFDHHHQPSSGSGSRLRSHDDGDDDDDQAGAQLGFTTSFLADSLQPQDCTSGIYPSPTSEDGDRTTDDEFLAGFEEDEDAPVLALAPSMHHSVSSSVRQPSTSSGVVVDGFGQSGVAGEGAGAHGPKMDLDLGGVVGGIAGMSGMDLVDLTSSGAGAGATTVALEPTYLNVNPTTLSLSQFQLSTTTATSASSTPTSSDDEDDEDSDDEEGFNPHLALPLPSLDMSSFTSLHPHHHNQQIPLYITPTTLTSSSNFHTDSSQFLPTTDLDLDFAPQPLLPLSPPAHSHHSSTSSRPRRSRTSYSPGHFVPSKSPPLPRRELLGIHKPQQQQQQQEVRRSSSSISNSSLASDFMGTGTGTKGKRSRGVGSGGGRGSSSLSSRSRSPSEPDDHTELSDDEGSLDDPLDQPHHHHLHLHLQGAMGGGGKDKRRKTEIPAVESDPSIKPYGCCYPCCLSSPPTTTTTGNNGKRKKKTTGAAAGGNGEESAFRTIRELRDHVSRHRRRGDRKGEYDFRCALDPCGKTFKSAAGLLWHFTSASAGHFFVSLEEGEDKPSKKFKPTVEPSGRVERCLVKGCGKRFKQAAGLAYHLSHTPNHPEQVTRAMLQQAGVSVTLRSKTRWWFRRLGLKIRGDEGFE
ncbi:hypothetical protein T439DRAFT_384743 [Meredithblackwellia eburnea MCA 4105]